MKTFARIITNIVFRLLFRVEVINVEKIPAEGPVLFCANHNSILDMFFLGYKLDRWIHWMAKDELFKNPILSFIITKLGAFPVKRGKGDVGSIKHAYKLLSENKIVGIFPQGTRIDPEKIETSRIKPGAAMIAANTGVKVLPAAVKGSYRIFSKMKVVYGEPFVIKKVDEKPTKEELTRISRDIINRVYSLSEVGS
jgi:1-acyl-sn-glycerol-3-phosphate acyltransferase